MEGRKEWGAGSMADVGVSDVEDFSKKADSNAEVSAAFKGIKLDCNF